VVPIVIARSPIHFAHRFRCPIIFFHGLDDKVVPLNQSETMVAGLKANGIAVALITFAGEQHGFRQASNIKRAILAEFQFFARIFGFVPADASEPLEIANLPD
jgi:dipeptidyl aminopeptidase/acylaminoacyl peptidase